MFWKTFEKSHVSNCVFSCFPHVSQNLYKNSYFPSGWVEVDKVCFLRLSKKNLHHSLLFCKIHKKNNNRQCLLKNVITEGKEVVVLHVMMVGEIQILHDITSARSSKVCLFVCLFVFCEIMAGLTHIFVCFFCYFLWYFPSATLLKGMASHRFLSTNNLCRSSFFKRML